MAPGDLTVGHRRRLREVWRSAGWPCHDLIELDLLAAGLLQRQWDDKGRETLRATDAGIGMLAAARRRNQAALCTHEALVDYVAERMQRAGRLVWRGPRQRAPLLSADGNVRWAAAKPDVYSIRRTSVEDYIEPVVHEVKVSRADARRFAPAAGRAGLSGAVQRCMRLPSSVWIALAAAVAEPPEPESQHWLGAGEPGSE